MVNTAAYLSQARPYDSGKVRDPLATLSSIEGLKQQKQKTKLGRKKLRDYDEDRAFSLDKIITETNRATAEEGRAMSGEARAKKKEARDVVKRAEDKAKAQDEEVDRELDSREKLMDDTTRRLPLVTLDNYADFHQEATLGGLHESILPAPGTFRTESELESWKSDMEDKLRQGRELLGKETGKVQQVRRYREAVRSGGYAGSYFDFQNKEKQAGEKVWVHNPENGIKMQVLPGRRDELVAGGRWQEGQPYGAKTKTMTRPQALKRMSDIEKARVSLSSNNTITDLLIAANPALAGQLGDPLTEDDKQGLYDAWDEEIAELRKVAPKEGSPVNYTYTETGELVK